MHRYVLAGLTLTSDTAIPELTESEGPDRGWLVELTTASASLPLDAGVMVEPDGDTYLAIDRHDDRYILHFPGYARFDLIPAEQRVVCVPGPDGDADTIRHLLLDHVVPRLLDLEGSVVLHASAVARGDLAIAFLGPSGAGKSSLAAEFAANSFSLLTDDFLHLTERADGEVKKYAAHPSYPGIRLWPDSAEALLAVDVADDSKKQRIALAPPRVPLNEASLAAVFVLGDWLTDGGLAFTFRRLSKREGFVRLFEQAFRMNPEGSDLHRADFARFSRLAQSVPLIHLDYRREYRLLPAVRDGILHAVRDLLTGL